MSFDLPPTWDGACLNYIGHDDVLADFASTLTPSSGEGAFAIDERPYTAWQPDPGDTAASLEILLSADKDVDYLGLLGLVVDGGALVVETNAAATAGTWVAIGTTFDGAAGPDFVRFDSRTVRRVRLRFTGSVGSGGLAKVAVVYLGQALAIPMQDVGWTPPRLARRNDASANVSNAGMFLGRSLYRGGSKFEIKATFLHIDWAYEFWLAFIRHAEQRPFFFSWQVTTGGYDNMFCWVEEDIPAPDFVNNLYIDATVPVVGVGIE